MRHCAEEAARCHVHVGAHPGLADAFGRGRSIPNVAEFTTLLEKQIANLLPIHSPCPCDKLYMRIPKGHPNQGHSLLQCSAEVLVLQYVPGILVIRYCYSLLFIVVVF